MTDGVDSGTPISSADSEAFARWFKLYHARVLAQCVRTLGDRAAAEDIAQETLLRAWLGRERMREEDLGAWLSVVARNLCISHIRRQKKQVPTEILPETADESIDPARLAERAESRRAVRAAMGQVGERHRRLLFLREVDGVDYEEISAELGLTPSGTRAVLFRARRVLRDRLAAVGEGFGAWIFGMRVRARLAVRSVSQPLEAMGAPIFQVGLAVVVAGGLAIPSAAVVAPGASGIGRTGRMATTRIVTQRQQSLGSTAKNLPSNTVEPGSIGPGNGDGYLLSERPGLTPDGGAHLGTDDPRPGHEGQTILGYSITWEPGKNYTPTQGHVSHGIAVIATKRACEAAPDLLCP